MANTSRFSRFTPWGLSILREQLECGGLAARLSALRRRTPSACRSPAKGRPGRVGQRRGRSQLAGGDFRTLKRTRTTPTRRGGSNWRRPMRPISASLTLRNLVDLRRPCCSGRPACWVLIPDLQAVLPPALSAGYLSTSTRTFDEQQVRLIKQLVPGRRQHRVRDWRRESGDLWLPGRRRALFFGRFQNDFPNAQVVRLEAAITARRPPHRHAVSANLMAQSAFQADACLLARRRRSSPDHSCTKPPSERRRRRSLWSSTVEQRSLGGHSFLLD